MSKDEVVENVLNVLEKRGQLTAIEIHQSIESELAIIQVHQAIKVLVDQGIVELNQEGNTKNFSLAAVQIDNSDITDVAKRVRDRTKYLFNGVEYSKGKLALAIISQYAKEHKPTFAKMAEVFPIKLIPTYGLFKPKGEALTISKKNARFFIKDVDILELPDGPVCVSNQFTKERIDKLIMIARNDLNYKIEVVDTL